MATTNGLTKRLDVLEAAFPAAACRACATRPVFTMDGTGDPCAECGRAPFTFTIDIDRASGRDDDAAA